jgi:nicotinamide-nucleotide amidase
MKAEIIAVGTELLMGQVVNSNAAYLSEQLGDLGIDVYYHVTVGDNWERLTEAIALATSRSNLILLSGGLGPTEDDITKQVLAKFLGEKLVTDPKGMEKLDNYFATTGRERTPNNDLQVLTLSHGKALQNATGLAVGTYIEKNERHYAILPGPPSELKPMMLHELMPILTRVAGENQQLFSRVLRFFGIGESQLVTKLAKLIETQTDPTIAPYAKTSEVTLRISTKAETSEIGESRLDKLEKEILATSDVGEFFYGYGDDTTLVDVVVQLLKKKGKTVSAAESLTAGMFQSTLGNVAGVSEVFKGGFVTYSLEMKAALLDIPEDELEAHGVVSEYTAVEMAEQARKKVSSDYALSFTGVAGPEELEGNAAGTVWIGLAIRGEKPTAEVYHFSRDRQYIRESAVMRGLDILRRELLK